MNERDYHDHHYAAEAAMIEGSALFRRVHERGARQFLRATGIGRGERVLSLGCGAGAIECMLARHVGEVVGTDISSVAIEQARARAAAAGLRNVSFAVADRDAADFGRFDAVAAFAFLHHLDDAAVATTLRSARQALRPGGVFYSADPSTRRLVGLFAGLVRGAYQRYHSPDERELNPARMEDAARSAGYASVVVGYTDYFLGPVAWLAPGTPRWFGGALEALDNLALGTPLVRRYASSFSLLAHAPA